MRQSSSCGEEERIRMRAVVMALLVEKGGGCLAVEEGREGEGGGEEDGEGLGFDGLGGLGEIDEVEV